MMRPYPWKLCRSPLSAPALKPIGNGVSGVIGLTYIERGAAFFNGITSRLQSATSVDSFKVNSGSGDRAWSVSFWFRQSNIDRGNQKIFSVANSTREQVSVWIVGDVNATGIADKLRFDINGNSGATILQRLESATRVKKNRWYHCVCTYDGLANGGLNVYLNGVKESATGTVTGAYTSAYNDTAMQTIIGAGRLSALDPIDGQIADVAAWDAELTQQQVTELYASGIPVDPALATFWNDSGIDRWLLNTDAVSLGEIALASTSVTLATLQVGSSVESISFAKSDLDNANYDSFGNLVNLGSEVAWYGRVAGSSHFASGDIGKVTIDTSNVWKDQLYEVVKSESDDLRGGCTGVVGSSVFTFSSLFDGGSPGTFLGANFYKSTDGLTGESFGSALSITPAYARYNFYGKVIPGFSSNEYFAPFYEHNSGVEWRVSLLKTTDNGDNWALQTVFEDTTLKLGESYFVNCGNNTLIGLCRSNVGGLYEIHSTDGGATWSTPVNTGLATGLSNAAIALGSDGKLYVVFMDRATDSIWLTTAASVAAIIADPTDWTTRKELFRSYTTDSLDIVGYPDLLEISNGRWLVSVSAEQASSRANLFFGLGRFVNMG